jgi:hypothetical protein
MTEEENRAIRVYEKTKALADGNAWAQGLSGIMGLGMNLLVDVVMIPFYVGLWNDIRGVYGKGSISVSAAQAYLKPNLDFMVQDFIWDKVVGSIPIVGIPFNIAFAKALAWRLGAWFGLLSALSNEEKYEETLIRSTMQLVKELFPSVGDVFSFKQPEEDKFIQLISSLDGLTPAVAQERSQKALDALRGKNS